MKKSYARVIMKSVIRKWFCVKLMGRRCWDKTETKRKKIHFAFFHSKKKTLMFWSEDERGVGEM